MYRNTLYSLNARIDWPTQKPDWAALQAVGRVESTRIIGDKTSAEHRYYLCSVTDLPRFAEGVRRHWAIENSQHGDLVKTPIEPEQIIPPKFWH